MIAFSLSDDSGFRSPLSGDIKGVEKRALAGDSQSRPYMILH